MLQQGEIKLLKQSDSESPSQMSSGESDPEAQQVKVLKHVNDLDESKIVSTPRDKQVNKVMWFSQSDQKSTNIKTNSSFIESDMASSQYVYDGEATKSSSSHQNECYQMPSQYTYVEQPKPQDQFLDKKFSVSQQNLPKKKLTFDQNVSFSHEFPYPNFESLYSTYTPFQQQQVRRRQFAPQAEMIRFQIYQDGIEYDGRTTLMIRNIPNKYTQPLILEDVNHNHYDKYDFFYLPIDFTNKCNVGYAFINFQEVKDIKDFFTQYHGQRWKMFNSEKVCQITYARIQGRDELLKHFQFSSIITLKDKKMKPVFFDKLSQLKH